MIDLAKQRAALMAQVAEFKKDCMELWFVPELAASYSNRDFFSYSIIEDNQAFFMIEQARQLWSFWNKAKAQAVPEWISVKDSMPEEGEEVLFLDSHNIIHEGSLNTDYVDGPYGENGEDLGDYQTLWASNSNGEEFLLEEIKFWMARPSDPITCGSGAANE
ncbi:DUF551 domain-containing protein [Acinetobacter baumannii]|uniref:DUF551 domain-containing protein n=1 Tax=Acinetobacter baumannii TaxID=470 RepID=UPI000F740808|nr:DUF551 domain-containing protein [Acinetobacter baumannii]RSP90774.1 DUF551 domain-containing protein [Acinetobacter baumannii]